MATGSSLLVMTLSYLPQLPDCSEMVMTTGWPSNESVSSGSNPAVANSLPSANGPPIQEMSFHLESWLQDKFKISTGIYSYTH